MHGAFIKLDIFNQSIILGWQCGLLYILNQPEPNSLLKGLGRTFTVLGQLMAWVHVRMWKLRPTGNPLP